MLPKVIRKKNNFYVKTFRQKLYHCCFKTCNFNMCYMIWNIRININRGENVVLSGWKLFCGFAKEKEDRIMALGCIFKHNWVFIGPLIHIAMWLTREYLKLKNKKKTINIVINNSKRRSYTCNVYIWGSCGYTKNHHIIKLQ